MPNFSHVEIKSLGDNTFAKQLYIDGRKIKGVRALSIHCKPDNPTRMILDLNVNDVSIDDFVVKYDKYLAREIEIVLKEEALPDGSVPTYTD